MVRLGDWFTKTDLKDAYLTVPACAEHQKYLHFSWKRINYKFTTLAFGLSPAPWAFTKLLKPAVALLRSKGIRLVIYLNDILIMTPSEEVAIEAVSTVRSLLESLGFVINEQKSIFTTNQLMDFLRFFN